jgi:hypothetical protein
MKDVINKIGDENGLGTGWLNEDFKNTVSYSYKLIENSRFYKKFCNCLSVRTVSDEYLLAMKVRSARIYKHDLSDIIGIIKEHQEMGKEITFELLNEAYRKLYDEDISEQMADKLNEIFKHIDLEELFYSTKEEENKNLEAVKRAEAEYKDAVNEKNINSFIEHFRN